MKIEILKIWQNEINSDLEWGINLIIFHETQFGRFSKVDPLTIEEIKKDWEEIEVVLHEDQLVLIPKIIRTQ